MAEQVTPKASVTRLRGSGPIDRKYLREVYAFRDKMKRQSKKSDKRR